MAAQFPKDNIFIVTSSGWIDVVTGTLVLICRLDGSAPLYASRQHQQP